MYITARRIPESVDIDHKSVSKKEFVIHLFSLIVIYVRIGKYFFILSLIFYYY